MSFIDLRQCLSSTYLFYRQKQTKSADRTEFLYASRKHLSSARIGVYLQPGMERVVEFELEHLNETWRSM